MKDIELERRNRIRKPRYWTILIFLTYLFFEILLESVLLAVRFDRETWSLQILGFNIPILSIVITVFGLIVLAIIIVNVSLRKKAQTKITPLPSSVEVSPYDFDPEDYKLG